MKAFVTGANGFLGSHLVDRLLERGDEVHTLIRRTSNLQWLIGKNVQFHYGDVTGDLKGLREGIAQVDVLFHVAGIIRALQPRTYYEVNAQATERILKTCLEVNPRLKRVVVVTSLAAHGPGVDDHPAREDDDCYPLTDYGKSKRDAEIIALKYADRLPVTIIRPPAIYGPRDDQIFDFFRIVRWGLAPLPGFGRRVLNLSHVGDVVTGLVLASESPKAPGEIFFVGEDRNYDWSEAADAIGAALHRRPLKVRLPETLIYGMGGISEIVGRVVRRSFPLNWDYAKNFLQRNWAVDIAKAKEILGFKPAFSLKEGAAQTADWYRSEGWF